MEIRRLDVSDQNLVHRHWEIGRRADLADRPYDFHTPWESVWRGYQHGRDDLERVVLGAFEDGVMQGAARTDLPLLDNLHAAYCQVYVDPAAVRHGLGRALDEACVEEARARGRRVLMTETYAPLEGPSAGLLFAEAAGYTQGLVDGIKVVDLVETEDTWPTLDARVAARLDGYRVLTWRDGVPDELVDGYCRLNEMFFDEAPMGELDVEPERWDRRRVAEQIERNRATGRLELAAGAVAPDGSLVALTELIVDDQARTRGFQSGTLVDPAHRGHHLGLAIKLANHRQLRKAYAECRVLMTGNADVNAPMNAVNDLLGYREVERCIELQKTI